MSTRIVAPILLAAAAGLAGCFSSAPAPEPPIDAVALFLELENRIATAEDVRIEFEVFCEGAIESNLAGTLRMQLGEETHLQAEGSFAGQDVRLSLEDDGTFLIGGSEGAHFEGPSPPALEEGLAIGCTRMGLLHNLAMLSTGAPPDATDGSARLWVQFRNMAYRKSADAPERFTFDIVVDGQDVGQATITLDEDGLPESREQVVQFPEGEMRVTEMYSVFEVE